MRGGGGLCVPRMADEPVTVPRKDLNVLLILARMALKHERPDDDQWTRALLRAVKRVEARAGYVERP